MYATVKRGDGWVRVSHVSGNVSAHAGRTKSSEITWLSINLGEHDEVVTRNDEVELYIPIEKILDLAEVLSVYLKEVRMVYAAKD